MNVVDIHMNVVDNVLCIPQVRLFQVICKAVDYNLFRGVFVVLTVSLVPALTLRAPQADVSSSFESAH